MVPGAKLGSRPVIYPKREILGEVFCILRCGCAWRLLPHDSPPGQIVYQCFRRWRKDGNWQRLRNRPRGDDALKRIFSRGGLACLASDVNLDGERLIYIPAYSPIHQNGHSRAEA
jgi:hypothetical protein